MGVAADGTTYGEGKRHNLKKFIPAVSYFLGWTGDKYCQAPATPDQTVDIPILNHHIPLLISFKNICTKTSTKTALLEYYL